MAGHGTIIAIGQTTLPLNIIIVQAQSLDCRPHERLYTGRGIPPTHQYLRVSRATSSGPPSEQQLQRTAKVSMGRAVVPVTRHRLACFRPPAYHPASVVSSVGDFCPVHCAEPERFYTGKPRNQQSPRRFESRDPSNYPTGNRIKHPYRAAPIFVGCHVVHLSGTYGSCA